MSAICPVYPKQQALPGLVGTSHLGQFRTHEARANAGLSDVRKRFHQFANGLDEHLSGRAISYALTEAMDEGHCGLPTEQLIPLGVELLEVPKELVQTALELELSDGTVIADTVGETACIFLGGLYRAEKLIAERITRLVNGALPWPFIDPAKALPWIEQKTALSMAESQIAAIRLSLLSKVLVITGGPGVGKTTIVNSILRILAAKGMKLLLGAPTGRAAKRMTEATGFEAKTIHRLLEVDPMGGGFKRNADNPLECDLLVIDETSMVDVMLMQALVKALR